MKKIIQIALIVAVTASVYQTGKPVVPKYRIEHRYDGSIAVYDARQVVIPKYIIRDDRVYPAGKPVIPLYRLDKRYNFQNP